MGRNLSIVWNRLSALRIFVTVLLLSPYLYLFLNLEQWSWPLNDKALKVFGFTFVQAVLSAFLSLLLGIVAGLELLRWPSWTKKRNFFEIFLMLPNLFPVIVVLLAAFNWLNPFPFGLIGILVVHTILNAGLCAVVLAWLMEEKVGVMAELALVEGAGRIQFLSKVLFGFLWRDLLLLWLFVFAICFTSFAVPLTIGGHDGITIEVLIYEKVRMAGGLPEAFGLAIMQTVVLMILSLLLAGRAELKPRRFCNMQWLSLRGGMIPCLLFSFLIIIGQFKDFVPGLRQLKNIPQLSEQLPQLVVSSIFVCLLTGFFVLAFLLLIAWAQPRSLFKSFLTGYMTPSSVLCGFFLLMIGPETGVLVYLKMSLGLCLVMVPAFYRMRWAGLLDSLRGQIQVANCLGASPGLLFFKVVGPQLIVPACLLAGIAAFWACGEFALTGIVAGQDLTLALTVEALMSSYRLEAATALIWLMLAVGGFCYLCFWGTARVLSEKS